ncbi:TPR repeat-containing thioredoxin TTL1-like isoform X2 [Tasmannia lanceolata]|uniref:TPR repeat-containing thioredoxin TTL1-like isoform X2 n=1 Tax=Tasmannia lanceolata TaxID=3420 RepID=UPI0040646E17
MRSHGQLAWIFTKGRKLGCSNAESVSDKSGPHHFLRRKQKSLSNDSANAAKHCTASSVGEKNGGNLPMRSLRKKVESQNSWNLKYGKSRRGVVGSALKEDVKMGVKSKHSQNAKISLSSENLQMGVKSKQSQNAKISPNSENLLMGVNSKHSQNAKISPSSEILQMGVKSKHSQNAKISPNSENLLMGVKNSKHSQNAQITPKSEILHMGVKSKHSRNAKIMSNSENLQMGVKSKHSQNVKIPPNSEVRIDVEKTENLQMGVESKHSQNVKILPNSKVRIDIEKTENLQMGVKSKHSQNVKMPNSGVGIDIEKTENLGRKNNAISYPHHIHSPPCPTDSRNHVNIHSSPSSTSFSSVESPNSVIRKQERESTSGTLDKSNPHTNVNKRERSTNHQIGSPISGNSNDVLSQAHRCQYGESILSYGNIYKGFKNAVPLTDPSHDRETHRSNTLVGFKGDVVDCKESKTVKPNSHVLGFGGGNYGHGNIVKGAMNAENLIIGTNCSNGRTKIRDGQLAFPTQSATPGDTNVEKLKNVGNEEFWRGHFFEAISLYDQAIALCPRNAPCHNNKAAALAGLGQYVEAVEECLVAIECDPSYSQAHYRIGSLYARLGRVEDAKWHFKLSGKQLESEAIQNILHLDTHISNIRKARNSQDWNCVLAESTLAIDAGADASDQVLAYKSEALLRLHKAKEALELLTAARTSKADKSRKVHQGDSSLLIIEVQVHMYLGRFEYGVIAAERAVNMDCTPESLMWLRTARAVTDARRNGNAFFKAGKYLEACTAYGQGLEYAPTNSVLLSNRAACRCKLGQWDMAVEDSNAALKYRPDYLKALLRRAHSNARLKFWEESLRDYKVLIQEMPGDPDIAQSLLQVQLELKKAKGQVHNMVGGQVTHVISYAQFLKTIKSAGFALLQFFAKSDDTCRQLSPLITELSQRYPSWNFLKVDIEENPDWAKFESITLVPIFIIYKDGLKLRELCKPDWEILEHALKVHSI